jgi:lysophospholipase L1-like esterase
LLLTPNALVRRFFRLTDRNDDVFPVGPAQGVITGGSFERLMIIGDRSAVGLGVHDHADGIGGQFAQHLATVRGGGIEWSAIELPRGRLGDAPALVTDLSAVIVTDVVVLMVGITDVLRLTSRGTWRTSLDDTLTKLDELLQNDAFIVVALVPPLEHLGGLSHLARFVAGSRARGFNRITREIVAAKPRSIAVAFPASLTPQLWQPWAQQRAYGTIYSRWAAALGDAVLALRRPVA